MTLDTRARRAAQGIRRSVENMEAMSTREPGKLERFDRFRDRKQRNRQVGALLVAALVVIATIVVVTNAFQRRDATVPVTPPSPKDRIVFGKQNSVGPASLFTTNLDGTDVHDLSVKSWCLSWSPDGTKILIGTTATTGEEWPATINPDGTGYRELVRTTSMTFGCGAFSPDGTRIVLGGSTHQYRVYRAGVSGIFTLRASDGGDLVRITPRSGAYPSYSPDGAQVVFLGVQGRGRVHQGELDGSIFVVNADGTGLHRIASHTGGFHFPPSWSPDGRLILFSTGRAVYVVHPNGARLRRITLESVPGLREAIYPSWSPDGTRFLFVGRRGADPWSNLFTARKDGTDVEQITHSRDINFFTPVWGPKAG